MSRRPLRAALACAFLSLALSGCIAPDQAVGGNPRGAPHGADPGQGLSTFEAVLYFAVVPAVVLVLIGLAAWLPGVVRGSRYRPGRGWDAPPVWFAGPTDPAAAVETAEVGEQNRGGASGSW